MSDITADATSDISAHGAIEAIEAIVDLDAYPLHEPDSDVYAALVDRCRAGWQAEGLFDLPGLLHAAALDDAVQGLRPLVDHHSFTHRRRHNIWFLRTVPGLAPDHPALREVETVNHTVCGDQMDGSPLVTLYEWPALRTFLADVIGLPTLHLMDDEISRLNVMSYREGEALNWHFDRSVFTTTVLLQQPNGGGMFEYRTDLRSDDDPNYDGVAVLVAGDDPLVRRHPAEPGTLTVFGGRNTAHRVTPAEGERDRLVAVFCYYDRPGVAFTDEERIGFYGRA